MKARLYGAPRSVQAESKRIELVSPWGLLPSEARAMDALIHCGKVKLAARHAGLSPKTIEQYIAAARLRIGEQIPMHAAFKWRDWRNGVLS